MRVTVLRLSPSHYRTRNGKRTACATLSYPAAHLKARLSVPVVMSKVCGAVPHAQFSANRNPAVAQQIEDPDKEHLARQFFKRE